MLRAAVIAAVVLIALPATAKASTLGRQGEIVTYQATDNVLDEFTLEENGVDLIFNVNVAMPTNGCGFRNTTKELGCPKAGLDEVDLNLGNFADTVSMDPNSPLPYSPDTIVHAGPGVDTLTMGGEHDVLFGEDDNDVLSGGAG